MSNRIFITGAGGFAGRALTRRGHAVIALPREAAAEALKSRRGEGDASLIHLAWPGARPTSGGGAAPLSDADFDAFLGRSLALREACAEAGVAFIGVGSGVEAHVEDDFGEPYLTYARRKLALHRALSPDSWLRLHFLFGEGEAPGRLVPSALRAALVGKAFPCGALSRRRHWAEIGDVADALADFARRPERGDFDLCGREALSFSDLFGLIGEAVGRPLAIDPPSGTVADGHIGLIAPANLAPNLPMDLGLRANLLARLKAYAVLVGAEGT